MGDVRLLGPVYEALVETDKGYSFHHTAVTYSFGWMYDGIVHRIELCRGAIAVLSEDNGVLSLKVFSEPGNNCWEEKLDELEYRLGIWEDLADYWRRAQSDPLVGGVAETMPGLRLRSTSIWAAFLIAVCQQNASFKQGWGMLYRLHRLVSRRLTAKSMGVYLETPLPENLSLDLLRKAGLGYRARTVMEAIRRRVHELGCSDIDEAREVRGVGKYTLALMRLLACRDYGALPLDRWLKRLASEAYGVPEQAVDAELHRRFGEYVGLAALHTTIAFDAEPISRALRRLREGKNKPGLVEPSPISLWRHTPP